MVSPMSEVEVMEALGGKISSESSKQSFFWICLSSSFLVEGEDMQEALDINPP